MTASRPRTLRSAAALALSVLLVACASVPPEQFHTLRPLPGATASHRAPTVAQAPGWRLAIAPIAIPALLDRPQWVLRQADQRLRVYEQQRWAQALPSEIAEALADAITAAAAQQARPGLALVRAPEADAALDAPLQLQFQVLKMDSIEAPTLAIDDQFEWALQCRSDAVRTPQAAPEPAPPIHHYFTGKVPLSSVPIDNSAIISEAQFDRLAQAHGAALRAAAQVIAAQAGALHCADP